MFFYFFIYFIMWAFKITILNTYINKMKYTRWGSIIYQKITCAVPESLFWEVYITLHTEILVLKGTYSFIVMSTHEIWVWKNTHSQSPALGIIQITYSWINKGIIAYLFWNYLGINHFYEIKNYRAMFVLTAGRYQQWNKTRQIFRETCNYDFSLLRKYRWNIYYRVS